MTEKTPVLFLDFDGPLTNARAYKVYDIIKNRETWSTPDPVVIDFLNLLYDKYKFKTVISSTWRIDGITPNGKDAIENLQDWGFKGEFHDSWKTPILYRSRELEIKEWFKNNIDTVSFYASLDDIQLPQWINNVLVDDINGMTNIKQFIELERYLTGKMGWSVKELRESNVIF